MIKFLIQLLLITSLCSEEMNDAAADKFTFPFWRDMNLLNKSTFKSEDHRAYVDLYVNDLAKNPYILESEKFPIGSIIVKPLYPKQKRENIARLMVMMKMKKGYDKKNSDWWYGVYDESGMNAYDQGRINSCITCHEVAEDTDYLFSESVMYKITSQPIFKDTNSIHKPVQKD